MKSPKFEALFFLAIAPALSACYAARLSSEDAFSARGDPLRSTLPRPPGGLNDECSFQSGPLNWPCEEGLQCIRSTSTPNDMEPPASNFGTCQMIMEGYTMSGLGPWAETSEAIPGGEGDLCRTEGDFGFNIPTQCEHPLTCAIWQEGKMDGMASLGTCQFLSQKVNSDQSTTTINTT